MDIKIDRNIYSDACISKAVYSLSKDYTISRSLIGNIETLHIKPSENEIKSEDIEKNLFSSLNDYKLRQIIEEETHDIRTILYAKAFADFDDIDENEEI